MASQVRRSVWFLSSQYALLCLNVVSGIVLIPFYLREIGLTTYGAWLATGDVLGWLMIVDPGLGSAIQQRVGVAMGRGDKAAIGGLIGSGALIMSSLGLVIAVVGIVAGPNLAHLLRLPASVDAHLLVRAYLFALAGTVMHFVAYSPAGAAVGMQRPHDVGAVAVAAALSSMAVTVAALLAGHGLLALGYGTLARGCVQYFGNAFVARRAAKSLGIRTCVTRNELHELVGLSAYTVLSQLANLLSGRVDSIVLTRTLGPSAAANLALMRRGPSLLTLVAERPSFSAMPVVSELHGAKQNDRINSIVVRLTELSIWLAGAGTAGFVALNGAFVRLWVGEQLDAGFVVNIFICLGIGLRVMTQSLSNYCMALGNIKGNGVARLCEAGVYVVFLGAGAAMFGLRGVAAADLLAGLSISAWYYPATLSRIAPIGSASRRTLMRELVLMMASGILAAIAATRLEVHTWSEFSGAAAVLVVVYFVSLAGLSIRFRTAFQSLARIAVSRRRT